MSPTDYILDSAVVLLVLVQIQERELTTKSLVRPLIVAGIAIVNYLHGIPTAGNDLVLVAVLALTGAAIGVASGQALFMRTGDHGQVLARAGWAAGFFWVLGMGGRFAFVFWVSHGGASTIGTFSAQHAITSGAAWTVALLAMVLAEVVGRTLTVLIRRERLQGRPVLSLT